MVNRDAAIPVVPSATVERPPPAAVRVALLTPPGRGGLAVVGLAGPEACRVADGFFEPRRGVPLAGRRDASISVGRWRSPGPDSGRTAGEELVVVRFAADRLEVHCHGGHEAAEAVIAGLERAGCVRQRWPDWLRSLGLDPIEVEAREAIALAGGPRAARILARQAAGALRGELERMNGLEARSRATCAARLLEAARVGLRLTDPWRVVLVGAVNAGKSSLANALAGHARSIVSPLPGTTRDLVTTRLVVDGWEIELIDTAGTTAAPGSVTERAGIERAEAARMAADLVVRVVPADSPPAAWAAARPHELLVVTKADLLAEPVAAGGAGLVTSVVDGLGIPELVAEIVARLVPEDRRDPGLLAGPVPFTLRQVALIRSLTAGPGLVSPSGS